MPDERDANTDAERGQIQYNHYKSKQIHSHRQSDCGVHRQNAHQPKKSGLFHPNKKRISDLDQANQNAENRQRVLEPNQYVWRKKIQRGPYQGPPEFGSIPPTAAEKFCQTSKEIDKAQVNL
jgi:hypothetical protein